MIAMLSRRTLRVNLMPFPLFRLHNHCCAKSTRRQAVTKPNPPPRRRSSCNVWESSARRSLRRDARKQSNRQAVKFAIVHFASGMCTPQYVTRKRSLPSNWILASVWAAKASSYRSMSDRSSSIRHVPAPAVWPGWTEQHVLPDIYHSKCVARRYPSGTSPNSFARDSVIRTPLPRHRSAAYCSPPLPSRVTIKRRTQLCVISKRGITANMLSSTSGCL